jgi:phosphomannomutase
MTVEQKLDHAYNRYIAEEPDEALREELAFLRAHPSKENQIELIDRLLCILQFGTAGIRAKMAAGYNRMNRVTIFRFSYALLEILKEIQQDPLHLLIGYDGRHHSKEFAHDMALYFSRYADVFLAPEAAPTPLLVFATKERSAHFGLIITASHNPKDDNGIKFFGADGAQISGEILKKIEEKMLLAPLRSEFFKLNEKILPKEAAWDIWHNIKNSYVDAIKEWRLFDENEMAKDFAFVYTPLHGLGTELFVKAAQEASFSKMALLQSQIKVDGDFPTLLFPNPEEEGALDLAHQEADSLGFDYVIAHDPDADRVQISVRDETGIMKKLTGNEIGSLLGYFIVLKSLKRAKKPLLATTIVSSRMLYHMATELSAFYVESLTGFSQISKAAKDFEAQNDCDFVFAYEEAIGFLVGDRILDKDGIHAGIRLLEIIGFLKKQGMSVWEMLNKLYTRFGLFENMQWSLRFSGIKGQEEIKEVMQKLRNQGDAERASMLFAEKCEFYDLMIEKRERPLKDCVANVLIYEIKGQRLVIRPSGTESKIKFYLEHWEQVTNEASIHARKTIVQKNMAKVRARIEQIILNKAD